MSRLSEVKVMLCVLALTLSVRMRAFVKMRMVRRTLAAKSRLNVTENVAESRLPVMLMQMGLSFILVKPSTMPG